MERTGEREVPSQPGTIEGVDPKHVQRYRWANLFTARKTVFDMACGTGYGSLLSNAETFIGFDNNHETVDYASEYYGKPGRRFVMADLEHLPDDLPLKPDVILSFETIEHLEHPEVFLDWCVSQQAMLVISTPIRRSFGRSHFHKFEYYLAEFQWELTTRWTHCEFFIQSTDAIGFPVGQEARGVVIGVCQP